MLTQDQLAALRARAATRVAGLHTPKQLEHAYLEVTPAEIIAVCDQARPASDDQATLLAAQQKVAELRFGSANAGAQAEFVYVRASDVLFVCDQVPSPTLTSAAAPDAAHAASDHDE